MTNEVIPFTFDVTGQTVRTVLVDGEPWFVAKDVAEVLEYSRSRNMTRMLDDDEVRAHNLRSNEGLREYQIISESGLYSVTISSRRPEAKAFRKWVTGTVLPSLRKDGMYIAGEEHVVTGELSEDELILKAHELLMKKVERLYNENKKLTDENNTLLIEKEELIEANIEMSNELTFLTVDEYRAMHGVVYPIQGMQQMFGKRAKKLCDERNIPYEMEEKRVYLTKVGKWKVTHVYRYPLEILDEVWPDVKNFYRIPN